MGRFASLGRFAGEGFGGRARLGPLRGSVVGGVCVLRRVSFFAAGALAVSPDEPRTTRTLSPGPLLAVPFKRAGSRPVRYLEHEEIEAILGTVDRRTVDGRHDYALLAADVLRALLAERGREPQSDKLVFRTHVTTNCLTTSSSDWNVPGWNFRVGRSNASFIEAPLVMAAPDAPQGGCSGRGSAPTTSPSAAAMRIGTRRRRLGDSRRAPGPRECRRYDPAHR